MDVGVLSRSPGRPPAASDSENSSTSADRGTHRLAPGSAGGKPVMHPQQAATSQFCPADWPDVSEVVHYTPSDDSRSRKRVSNLVNYSGKDESMARTDRVSRRSLLKGAAAAAAGG